MNIHAQDIEGLLLAVLLGAVIGMDREYRGKPAGFRTLMLVSMGAAIFSMVSYKMALMDPYSNSDVTRIASNIVAGIGFLGAGIIFRNGQDIRGLTTAATIWIAAAIGMAAGIGSFTLAILGTIITWITLFLLHIVQKKIEEISTTEKYRVTWRSDQNEQMVCEDFFQGLSFKLKDEKISKKHEFVVAEWTITASKKMQKKIVEKMLTDPRIVELEH